MFLLQDYTLDGVPAADAAPADAETRTGTRRAHRRTNGIQAGKRQLGCSPVDRMLGAHE